MGMRPARGGEGEMGRDCEDLSNYLRATHNNSGVCVGFGRMDGLRALITKEGAIR